MILVNPVPNGQPLDGHRLRVRIYRQIDVHTASIGFALEERLGVDQYRPDQDASLVERVACNAIVVYGDLNRLCGARTADSLGGDDGGVVSRLDVRREWCC